ncbi:MAG: DNA mismatch repair protein MutS [Bacteroidales bacterium]|jgi:DNA mismatch repair protein MutS|nr:DNA mismatch repair protein MutS [Bacteroidales bacterium]MDI9576408.1 DNA mismatch repair protein MutS [Bacteroidota bacterium]MDD2593295.1 DNA mismatch repair protein MutS [Bacteroidales bacterium]MDD3754833.1 DNA mismatch repair protein MutS [Bacteroidales bacterium]MDY0400127.1 DNA mismatch repair protein MutS [Bacteroidales bacterium]
MAKKLTPLMKQYWEIKSQYPDTILLFRIGDFYETFGEDARIASQVLGIVLTKRHSGAAADEDLAGFPHHSLDTYLPRLVRAGYRVAICEQLEDPKLAKTIVKRGVTELVTPGVVFTDNVLMQKENNFLAAYYYEKDLHGIALLDVSTGDFFATQGDKDFIKRILESHHPTEVLLSKEQKEYFLDDLGDYPVFTFDSWIFQYDFARDKLIEQFETENLKGFGLEDMPLAQICAGVSLYYVSSTQQRQLSNITSISRIDNNDYMWLDNFTIKNLELLEPLHNEGISFRKIIDHCVTPMGSRLLSRWIIMPIIDINIINWRLNIVDFFVNNNEKLQLIRENLSSIGDIERMVGRLASQKINPKELLQLANAIDVAFNIQKILDDVPDFFNNKKKIDHKLINIVNKIRNTIVEEPPASIQKGDCIKDGINVELDELRNIKNHSKEILKEILQREIKNTGIASLKIGFNNIFGYYFEVTNPHKNKVPASWVRKQTLTQAERYTTEELKTYEDKIISAETRIMQLELEEYDILLDGLIPYCRDLLYAGHLIAELDVLTNFAHIAIINDYKRPVLTDDLIIDIDQGRHPVIEKMLKAGERYIPNDLYLDTNNQQIIVLTGPNMAGKSAFLRQTALIVIMAQMGSFVPANKAIIGIVDKLFTRVGASDNISLGESTFMMEMNETASILNNLSERSLILLDEIGRGTSTFDGISIAMAIIEYLHNHPYYRPKTIFATHYHELNEVANYLERVKNFHFSVKEIDNKIIFLRKLEEGGTEHSFGIHVARMAGIPNIVVNRANNILKQLEADRENNKWEEKPLNKGIQLSLFQLDDPLLEELRQMILSLDLDQLTPLEALMQLNLIKSKLKSSK